MNGIVGREMVTGREMNEILDIFYEVSTLLWKKKKIDN